VTPIALLAASGKPVNAKTGSGGTSTSTGGGPYSSG